MGRLQGKSSVAEGLRGEELLVKREVGGGGGGSGVQPSRSFPRDLLTRPHLLRAGQLELPTIHLP